MVVRPGRSLRQTVEGGSVGEGQLGEKINTRSIKNWLLLVQFSMQIDR
jgi:hypothetical protein